MTRGWTEERATAWIDAGPRRWPRAVLIVLGLAAAVATTVQGNTTCTPISPCTTNPSVAAWALHLAALIIGWSFPILAAVAAVGFAGYELAFSDLAIARVAFPVWALLHVVHVGYLWRARTRQSRLATLASVPIPAEWQRPLTVGQPPWTPKARLVGAALALVGALLAWLVYTSKTDADDALMDEAQVVAATVTAVHPRDPLLITVTPKATVSGLPRTLEFSVVEDYAVGDEAPIRFNAADPGWTHLVAEPPDRGRWLFLTAAALLVGAGVIVIVGMTVVRRRRLISQPVNAGVPARVLRAPDGDVAALGAVDRDLVCATTRVPAQEEGPPEDAFVVGSFHDGGFVGLLTRDGAVVGTGPLRALPSPVPFDGAWAESDDADDPDGLLARSEPVPIDAAEPLLELPWTERPMSRTLAKGVAQVLLGAVITLAILLGVPGASVWRAVLFGILAVILFVDGANSLLSVARVDRTTVRHSSAWRHVDTPLAAVREVRHAGGVVVLRAETRRGDSADDEPEVITIRTGQARELALSIEDARDRAASATAVSRWRWTAAPLALALMVVVAATLRATPFWPF